MRSARAIVEWGIVVLVALVFFEGYQRYQSAVQLQYRLQQQLDSLRFVNAQLQNTTPALPPDTVKIIRWRTVTVPVPSPPDTVHDTIVVIQKLPDYYESHRFYSDEFLNANLYAYAPCAVDSFRLDYRLKMANIYQRTRPVIRINPPPHPNDRWRYFFYGVGAGMVTLSIIGALR